MTETTATTDTAAPAAAPASESTATPAAAPPTEAAPAMDAAPQSTPDIFSGQTQKAPPSRDLMSQLYTSEGTLSENYSSLLEENGLGELTNTVAKYKSPEGLLKGAANLISFAGKKIEGVVVPNEGSSEQEIADYRQAIGVPESSTAYDLKPENLPPGMDWDDNLAGTWQNAFHEAGISQTQAQALSQAYSDITNTQLEQANEKLAANSAAEMAEQQAQMQKEWGGNYAHNLQSAVDMAEVVGFDMENQSDMQALRHPKVLNLLLAKSQSMQEGTLPRGGDPASSMGDNSRAIADKIYIKHNGKVHLAPKHEQQAYNEHRRLQHQQQSR